MAKKKDEKRKAFDTFKTAAVGLIIKALSLIDEREMKVTHHGKVYTITIDIEPNKLDENE